MAKPEGTGEPLAAEKLAGQKVLVLGDLMLDAYLVGDTERISPEAPVPVVRIENENLLLGGAGNVAANIAALGGKATVIGTCGNDQAARSLEDLLRAQGIKPVLQQLAGRCTTVKTRVMARRQQMLRLDRECTAPLHEDERERLLGAIRDELHDHAVLILSDYAKGFVDAAFMADLHRLVTQCGHDVKLLVDPKPAHFSLFTCADLLTPNLKETGEGIHMPVSTQEEIIKAGQRILETVGCRHLLSTLGPQGRALFLSPHEVWHIPTVARDVYDVTGAGDTVIATTGLALAAGFSHLQACILANHAAGIVVGKVGAATASVSEIVGSMRHPSSPAPAKWV